MEETFLLVLRLRVEGTSPSVFEDLFMKEIENKEGEQCGSYEMKNA